MEGDTSEKEEKKISAHRSNGRNREAKAKGKQENKEPLNQS